MSEAVRFSDVTKAFRPGRQRNIKDALLSNRRHRMQAEPVTAISRLSFTVTVGESVAILGHNGSGKSTTLKLLARTLRPTSGTVWSCGRIAPILELGSGFHPDLTGRENIFLNGAVLGVSRRYLSQHLEEIIEFSGLSEQIDLPVRFYSSGMVVRLGFSIAVHVEPETILVDEVLAVGDLGFQEKCLSRMQEMKREGRTVLLVTHSLEQAESFCGRAIVMSRGSAVFDGHIGDARPAYLESVHELDR